MSDSTPLWNSCPLSSSPSSQYPYPVSSWSSWSSYANITSEPLFEIIAPNAWFLLNQIHRVILTGHPNFEDRNGGFHPRPRTPPGSPPSRHSSRSPDRDVHEDRDHENGDDDNNADEESDDELGDLPAPVFAWLRVQIRFKILCFVLLSNEYEILSTRWNLNNKLFNTIPRFITVMGYIIVYVILWDDDNFCNAGWRLNKILCNKTSSTSWDYFSSGTIPLLVGYLVVSCY